MADVPATFADLLDGPVVVAFVTYMENGDAHVTPMWCAYDGQHVRVNVAADDQKAQNVARDPRVSLLAVDPNDSYRWLEAKGRVVETQEDASLIEQLAHQYTGQPFYGGVMPESKRGERRLTLAIALDEVNGESRDAYAPDGDA